MPTVKARLAALEGCQQSTGRSFAHLTTPELKALLTTRDAPDTLAAAAALLGVSVEHLSQRIEAGQVADPVNVNMLTADR